MSGVIKILYDKVRPDKIHEPLLRPCLFDRALILILNVEVVVGDFGTGDDYLASSALEIACSNDVRE